MRALLLGKYMCGIVECAILSVDKKGKLKEIHTYGVVTTGDAGPSRICLLEFQQFSSHNHSEVEVYRLFTWKRHQQIHGILWVHCLSWG
jgi:hypothetical protein